MTDKDKVARDILSDITVHMKYARYLPEKERRETWTEIVDRNKSMHIKKYPELESEINSAYQMVYDKKVLPSMRSMQFGGKPIEVAPNRIYNCAFAPIDDWRVFSEIMFFAFGRNRGWVQCAETPCRKTARDSKACFQKNTPLLGE